MSRIFPTQKEIFYDEVIRLRHQENLSIREITKKTGVCKSVVQRWISTFASGNPEKPTDMKKQKPRLEKDAVTPAERSEFAEDVSKDAEIALLKEKLRMANMRADAYNELINVAEKQFNISIRKKAGAKQ